METMTPSEQIDWIEADARKLCETKMRVPSLVYIVSVVDHYALVESMRSVSGSKPHTRDGRLWLHVGLRPVEVIADPNKPSGLSPSRCYRCDCGELFVDDRSRSGKCAACLQRRIATTIRTPVGDIPMIADPTLRPGEFRIEPAPWNLDADLRERLAGASDAPSADPLPRSEHRSKAFGYVDTNIGRALCAADNQRVLESPRLMSLGHSSAFRGVDRSAPVQSLRAAPPRRPDGFDQARIDEIKAALLETGRKR